MGMCQGCNKVFNTLQMKDGFCEECYKKEFGVSFESTKANESEVITSEIKPLSNTAKYSMLGISAIFIIGIGTLIYKGTTNPPEDIVKNIASQYTYEPVASITLVNSYEKEGKQVQILRTATSICEMPMIKANGEWMATGIECH